MTQDDITAARLSRRTILRAGAAVGATTLLGAAAAPVWAEQAQPQHAIDSGPPVEPGAGGWTTWLLGSGDQLRLPPPPGKHATRAELDELEALAAQRDAAALASIHYWNAGAPGYRWNQLAIAHGVDTGILLLAYRMLALMNVAIYDATVAAWDSKYTYHRRRPSEFKFGGHSSTLSTVIANPASPSYPCEHAVAAGAAAAVLSYIFPDDAAYFAGLAEEAGRSRLVAGVAYPSDVANGLALGRQVAELAIARGMADGSDVPWDGEIPEGPGLWSGEPAFPTMGNWTTWVLANGSELRPSPPPAWDSLERAAELEEVRNYPRDVNPGAELSYWAEHPGGRPAPDSVPISSNQLVFYYAPPLHHLWNPELNQKLFEYRLDANPPRAARAYALVSVAGYDATVACWEAKFHYWTARPNQFDPTLTTVLPTYPIPDYPSGHAATYGGTQEVLAYLFPRDAHFFQSRAAENAASRLWAGIHFRSACDVGLALGRAVGQKVVERASTDGAG
jgi:membrane-associated phospholipid phosphatase